MSLLSHQKQTIYDIGIIASVIVAIIITYVCLNNGIYEVFPGLISSRWCLLHIPVLKFGIYGTVLVGWLYFVLVYFWEIPDPQLFTLATIRFYVFVSIGSSYQSSPRNIGKGSKQTIRYIIILREMFSALIKKPLK